MNWDNRISSFKFHQSGAIKSWLDGHGYSGNGTYLDFCMFRVQGYPQIPSGNYLKIWRLHPRYGTQDADWLIPNLRKEKLGNLWSTNMNDAISAISVVFCKSKSCVYFF
ncbi:MAG: hypothetical protein ABI851_13820 [Saprospiraceae bacterium]